MTSVWLAKEILNGKQLETRPCRIFGRDLIYFFVLRPAYRRKDSEQKSHQINRFPFVFVLSPDAVAIPHHVYPFDTGGAASGAFSDQADPNIPLEDYELEPTHLAAAAHIGWAFGSASAYYSGELRPDLVGNVPEYETVTRGFYDIARMGRAESNKHDKRASAVEIASSHDVPLKGNVLLAVLPKQYLEWDGMFNAQLKNCLDDIGTELLVYDWQPNTSPIEFQDEIARIVRGWLAQHGHI